MHPETYVGHARHGVAGRGKAGRGPARRGMARPGEARPGPARRGKARQGISKFAWAGFAMTAACLHAVMCRLDNVLHAAVFTIIVGVTAGLLTLVVWFLLMMAIVRELPLFMFYDPFYALISPWTWFAAGALAGMAFAILDFEGEDFS